MADRIQMNKLGINWKLRYDLERRRNELLETRIDILIRRLRKYEDYNTRPARNRKDAVVHGVHSSGANAWAAEGVVLRPDRSEEFGGGVARHSDGYQCTSGRGRRYRGADHAHGSRLRRTGRVSVGV